MNLLKFNYQKSDINHTFYLASFSVFTVMRYCNLRFVNYGIMSNFLANVGINCYVFQMVVIFVNIKKTFPNLNIHLDLSGFFLLL